MVIDYCCFVNLSIIEEEIEEEIPKDIKNDRLIWKQIDLFNPSSAENFLQGSEVLIYLIHSLGAKIFEELDIRLSNSAGRKQDSIPLLNKSSLTPNTASIFVGLQRTEN